MPDLKWTEKDNQPPATLRDKQLWKKDTVKKLKLQRKVKTSWMEKIKCHITASPQALQNANFCMDDPKLTDNLRKKNNFEASFR